MRYTTVIDISEIPGVYRNRKTRLVYLHLCLRCGYHDADRDIYDRSLRALASDCGLSLSAVRNALKQLESARLVAKHGGVLYVRKWLAEQPITARPKTAKQQAAADEKARREQERQQREKAAADEAASRQLLETQGKTQFMVYFESKMAAAAAGDPDAIAVVNNPTRRAMYENDKKNMEQKTKAR